MQKTLAAERFPLWKRACPELSDINFINLGLLRCINRIDSGRHFLQVSEDIHSEPCPHSTYFKSLQSPRSLNPLSFCQH